jgi:poly(3-hydroxybutyrate) depolymerase
MKIPTPTLPDVFSPLRGLSTLKMGLAELTRARRTWTGAFAPSGAEAAGGVLEEVAEFGANPGELRMLRFVPPGLPPGAPLVVVLHGCTQTATGYDKGAGWSTLAARLEPVEA